eukprot:CAMPEP_0177645526 /NCGR_PEP_ID=MMETSP0447-20121125/9297_1 /TAXON_ID=0 /ORGANISM="Stygamoeba regulata, Strain BSH-02190019" /LENGTH=309 /DNA_ID=CAMNT_0019148017 /DNA_START=415 /DNA_END=1344 /DNA_ORIENTATION=+
MLHTNPHKTRSAEILKRFPEIRHLFGHDPSTQLYAYASVGAQFAVAYAVSASFPLALLAALTVGPYGMMCILVFMHEASHNLIFASPLANRIIGNFTNIPMLVPVFEIFRQHHNAHHNHLGDHFMDVDCPLAMEVEIVGSSPLRKALWLFFNPAILALRSLWKLQVKGSVWVVGNWIVTLGTGALLAWFATPAFVYLAVSTWLSQGLHPSNARVVQRHVRKSGTPNDPTDVNTHSYYGPVNAITLNVGYHREHHDFSRIPHSRLPALKALAGEKWYPSSLAHETRGPRAIAEFILNPAIDLSWYYKSER